MCVAACTNVGQSVNYKIACGTMQSRNYPEKSKSCSIGISGKKYRHIWHLVTNKLRPQSTRCNCQTPADDISAVILKHIGPIGIILVASIDPLQIPSKWTPGNRQIMANHICKFPSLNSCQTNGCFAFSNNR